MSSTNKSLSRFGMFLAIFLTGLIIDQAIKEIVRLNLAPHQAPGYPWPGVFEITLSYNKGVAWGMFQGQGVYFTPLALLITAGCVFYSYKHRQSDKLTHVILGLLSAGAIGNLIDRLYFGYVTDMFWFRLINFPVFNFADSCITAAAFLIIIKTLFSK